MQCGPYANVCALFWCERQSLGVASPHSCWLKHNFVVVVVVMLSAHCVTQKATWAALPSKRTCWPLEWAIEEGELPVLPLQFERPVDDEQTGASRATLWARRRRSRDDHDSLARSNCPLITMRNVCSEHGSPLAIVIIIINNNNIMTSFSLNIWLACWTRALAPQRKRWYNHNNDDYDCKYWFY